MISHLIVYLRTMNKESADTMLKPAACQEEQDVPVGAVRCLLCPHGCLIGEGKRGICRTRVNHGGCLYTLAYGNPCSLAIDPIEKKPLYHFFPGSDIFSLATAGCNFHCLNCQNWSISQESPDKITHYNLTPRQVVEQALSYHVPGIAFTYTEPAVYYEYMLDIAEQARQENLKTVLVSNGFINPIPLENLCRVLDAANIDLKCFDDTCYRELTGGRLQPVLDTLLALKAARVWTEITHLIIPGRTDNPALFEAMCRWLVKNGFADTPLHISRFFPTYKLSGLPPTPVETLVKARETALQQGIRYVYIGNAPELNAEDTLCPGCSHVLVKRKGFGSGKIHIKENRCTYCGTHVPGVWE